jgi:hypothetical protein
VKFDPEVEVVLEFARMAREPPSAERLRNLEAVRSRLAAAGATASVGQGAGAAAPERMEHTGVRAVPSSPRANTLAQRRLLASRPPIVRASLRQLVVTGVVTGAVGVLIGFGLGRRSSDTASEGQSLEGRSAAASAVQAAATEGGVDKQENAARAARDDVGSSAAPAARAETPSVVSELESTSAARDQPAVARGGPTGADRARQTASSRAKVGRSSGRPSDAPPTTPLDRSFFVALRLIERARHALDVGEPMLAHSLLDELDERFPSDLLEEERLATRALGWCALGERGRAESAARELLADNPRSIYAERLEQSCVRARVMGSK